MLIKEEEKKKIDSSFESSKVKKIKMTSNI